MLQRADEGGVTVKRKRRVFREFFAGASLLGRGLKVWATAPRLMLLGMIPAMIVGTLFFAGFVVLALSLETLAELTTPFAAGWDEPWRTSIRVVAGLSFLAVAILVIVFTFTTLTLIVGDPFYERIWRHVEGGFGAVPDQNASGFWRTLGIGVVAGLRILVPTVLIGLLLFPLGFIPVVGPVLVPLLAALFGGWYVALELTGRVFDSRGISPRDRRRVLGTRRAATVGFGAATYLSFLIPLGAVIMMPAAVAGATLLGRRALEEAHVPPPLKAQAAPTRIER